MDTIYEKFIKEDLNLPEAASLTLVNNSLREDSFKGNITEGFNIFILIKQLTLALPDVKKKIDVFSQTNVYQFFKENTGNVEVTKDNDIMTIYFPIRPVTHYLTPNTKSDFVLTVNRDSN